MHTNLLPNPSVRCKHNQLRFNPKIVRITFCLREGTSLSFDFHILCRNLHCIKKKSDLPPGDQSDYTQEWVGDDANAYKQEVAIFILKRFALILILPGIIFQTYLLNFMIIYFFLAIIILPW